MNVIPPVEIGAWLACLFFVVALFNQSTKAWFNVRGKPTPLEQQEATQSIATRVERLEVCQCEQARRLEAVEEESQKMRDKLGTEIDKVFHRVNAVADIAATMSGELKGIHMQLGLLLNRRR